MPRSLTPICFTCKPGLLAAAKAFCDKEGRTMSGLTRVALREFLERQGVVVDD